MMGSRTVPLAASHRRVRSHKRRRALLFLFHLFVEGFGFLDGDEPIAVGVDSLELLVRAEELAARHIAIAVAIHLHEPRRTTRRWRWLLRPAATHARRDDRESATRETGIARPH